MKTADFLRAVVTSDEGHFLLATRDTQAGWQEYWYDWPRQLDTLVGDAAEHAASERDVYFSAHLFAERTSRKAAVLPTRTVQADLDNADVMALPVVPTFVVNTSRDRHQGYWVLGETLTPAEVEEIARRIAYGVKDCDRTGWPAGHRMRLPGTYNFKYGSPQNIEVTGHLVRSLDLEAFHLFPETLVSRGQAEYDTDWILQPHTHIAVGPIELMTEAKISPALVTAYNTPHRDRSKYLWNLMQSCFRAGLSRDQVYWIASQTVNNKFRDRVHSAVSDLRKDVVRAEAVALDRSLDVKAAVMEWRQKTGVAKIKKLMGIAELVIARMREDGELVHTRGDQLWFMRRDTGRPIEISERSVWFDAYLQRTFDLNPAEQEARYTKAAVVNFIRNQAATAEVAALSRYEPNTRSLLIHTGGRDVLHVFADRIETHANGYGHVVFKVGDQVEPFKLIDPTDVPRILGGQRWYEFLFGPQLQHIDGALSCDEAVCLLRAWFMFLLFRSIMTNRPILAMMGPPGSGKSTTAKKLYRLLYGTHRYVGRISDENAFNTETINFPFVCYDNVDTYERWLPDALAQAAGITEVTVRRLWTDVDTITQARQALLMLTAHNPRFTREDVVDRLIVITLKRLPMWLPEADLLNEVTVARNALWTDILQDVQAVLGTSMPTAQETPQFRIQDYARYGTWFSRAANLEDMFKAAITKLVGNQRGLNLETDQLLVATIAKWIRVQRAAAAKRGQPYEPEYRTASNLWAEWIPCAPDPITFQRFYRNALQISRKLVTLQDSLKEVFDVDVKYDAAHGARTWRIGPKEGSDESEPEPDDDDAGHS